MVYRHANASGIQSSFRFDSHNKSPFSLLRPLVFQVPVSSLGLNTKSCLVISLLFKRVGVSQAKNTTLPSNCGAITLPESHGYHRCKLPHISFSRRQTWHARLRCFIRSSFDSKSTHLTAQLCILFCSVRSIWDKQSLAGDHFRHNCRECRFKSPAQWIATFAKTLSSVARCTQFVAGIFLGTEKTLVKCADATTQSLHMKSNRYRLGWCALYTVFWSWRRSFGVVCVHSHRSICSNRFRLLRVLEPCHRHYWGELRIRLSWDPRLDLVEGPFLLNLSSSAVDASSLNSTALHHYVIASFRLPSW